MGGAFSNLTWRQGKFLDWLASWKMKVDDPQLSSVCLVIHCFLRVNLLFRKYVGCGGPKLTGGASGRGVLRGTFGPGQKKKKGNHGHNYPSSSEILVSNSLFFLSADSTITLYSHFKF